MVPPPAGILHEGRIDPEALMAIRSLELRAKVVVEGIRKGLHRSLTRGFSAEFTEYRGYVPGDDLRTLDWRVRARLDRWVVKRYEDETNLNATFLVDQSRSMAYGSAAVSKEQYAATLAATLGLLLSRQGDAVGVACFDDRLRRRVPPRHRPGSWHRLLLALDQPTRGRSTDLSRPLRQIAGTLTRRGMLVLISDLLGDLDDWARHLGALAAASHDVLVFHVLDPVEQTLDWADAQWVEDLESGRDLYVDPAVAVAAYRRRFAAHCRDIEAACQRHGIDYFRMTTDRAVDRALLEVLQARQGRRQRLRGRPRGRS